MKEKGKLMEAKGHYYKQNYELSEKLSKEILEETEIINEECSIINKINALARIYYIRKRQKKFIDAYKYLQKRENLVEKLPQKNNHYQLHKISVLKDKASIDLILENYTNAIEKLKLCNNRLENINFNKNDAISTGLLIHQVSAYNMLGNTYTLLYNKTKIDSYLDSALVSYNDSYAKEQLIKPQNNGAKPYFDFRLIKIFTKKKQYKEALQLLNKYDNSTEYLDKINLLDDYFYYKFFFYNNLNQKDSTLYFGKKYIQDKKLHKNINTVAVYDTISEIYAKLHMNDSAYHYAKKSADIYKEINKNIDILKNQILQDDQEVILSKDEVLSKKNQSLKKYQYAAIGIVLILSIALTILLLIYKKRSKKRKDIQQININSALEKKILNDLKSYEKTNFFLNKESTLSSLANDINTNTTYLSHLIKTYHKKSFNRYLFDLRIAYITDKIKNERKYKNYTIQSLAEEIGYTNASAFTRAFKKYKNMTPSEYFRDLPPTPSKGGGA